MKLKALKCQLDFRKIVLDQSGPRELFFMSKNRKKLSVDEVVCNLLSLISPSRMSTPILHLLLLHKKV